MKILMTFVVAIACVNAAAVDNKYDLDFNNRFNFIRDRHYTQHQSSVDNARIGMQERLSKLEVQSGAYQRSYGGGGSENYVAGCSTCSGSGSAYNSRSSSSSSTQNSRSGVNSDYVGVGIVGHTNDDDDVQMRLSSQYSNAYEADDLQQRIVPGDLNSIRASEYRSANSRNEHEEEDDEVQKTVAVGFHDGAANSDRYSYSQRRQQQQQQQQSEYESRSSTSRTVPVYYVPVSSQILASQRSSASGSESEVNENRNRVSMAVRPGTTTVLRVPIQVNYSPGSTDQQISSSRSDYQAGSESTQSRVQPGYRVTHYPSSTYLSSSDRASASRAEESSRTSATQQPEKYSSAGLTAYNSFNNLDSQSQSRYNAEDSQVQERVSPSIDNSASSSSSRYGASNYQRGSTASRVIPAFPINTIESSSSQRTAEEREQRRYASSRPNYVTNTQRTISSSSNVAENESSGSQLSSILRRPAVQTTSTRVSSGNEDASSSSSQYGSSRGTYYTVPTSSRSQYGLESQNQYQSGSAAQNQYQSGSAAQNQYQSGTGSTGYVRNQYGSLVRPSLSTSSQYGAASTGSLGSSASSQLHSRFGSDVRQANSEDLFQYMSESERLAREQQRQIASESSRSSSARTAEEANQRTVNTAASLDALAANFVGQGNLANRLNSEFDTVETYPGSGNYKRVKSWQKQSKWASGSEYDQDGKIKSHSMLSTAEAEKHNIDDKEVGYKAATTTLENDGKVSTYSIHTP